MAQTIISLKNVAAPVKTVVLRDLNDATIPTATTLDVSDTNLYAAIKWSRDLYNAINLNEIVINIDGVDLTKAESFVYMQDNTITGGIVNNYKGKSATDPVGTFAGGETYFNTVLNVMMEYDPSRSKWLSQNSIIYSFSRNGITASGSYFNMGGGIIMNPGITGYLTFANVTLVGIQLTRTDADAVTIEVMDDLVVAGELALLAATPTGTTITLNADIADPAVLTVRVKPATNSITDAAGAFAIKLRI